MGAPPKPEQLNTIFIFFSKNKTTWEAEHESNVSPRFERYT